METKMDIALRVMRVFNSFDGPSCDEVWWRTDGQYGPVTMLVNCNDLFFWGCADCEEVTAENIDLLESTYAELQALSDRAAEDTASLFCARSRGARPQGACYKSFRPETVPLFNACGEERAVGFGNPVAATLPTGEAG